MVYVYDIVLNLNNELLEFFEWEDNDRIKYIKKVPLIKTDDAFIYDLINNNIKLEDSFINDIKNKTIYYDNDEKNYPIIIIPLLTFRFGQNNIIIVYLVVFLRFFARRGRRRGSDLHSLCRHFSTRNHRNCGY